MCVLWVSPLGNRRFVQTARQSDCHITNSPAEKRAETAASHPTKHAASKQAASQVIHHLPRTKAFSQSTRQVLFFLTLWLDNEINFSVCWSWVKHLKRGATDMLFSFDSAALSMSMNAKNLFPPLPQCHKCRCCLCFHPCFYCFWCSNLTGGTAQGLAERLHKYICDLFERCMHQY